MGDIQGSAVFTERNGWKLRMRLDRWWCDEPRALVRMANPSRAGAEWNDPTTHGLIRLTRRRPGVGGFTAVNWEPYIATDPADLYRWREAAARNDREAYTFLRRDNLGLIRSLSAETAIRFVAWGNLVLASGLRRDVIDAMSLCGQHDLYAFGLTLDGSPKHPLARGKHRIPDDDPAVIWRSRQQQAT